MTQRELAERLIAQARAQGVNLVGPGGLPADLTKQSPTVPIEPSSPAERRRVPNNQLVYFHRHHAVVELNIRDLKEGAGLEHMPSGNFLANAAWLCCAVLAHNLIRWTTTIADIETEHDAGRFIVTRTIRVQLLAVPGRLVNRTGTPTLRLPLNWPWADTFHRALDALRAMPTVPD